jgi:hypothetical protein
MESPKPSNAADRPFVVEVALETLQPPSSTVS